MERAGFEADRFHVVIIDLKTGQRRALTKDWDRSVDSMAFANDGRTLYVTTDHFGQHPLWAVDVKTGKPTMLTGPGRIESFSVGEKEIVMSTSSLKSPAELQALTIKGGDLRALPRMNETALAQIKFGEPEQFTFAGADGATVYGYVMKPANFKAGAKYPVAFIIHGGPQSSFANSVELPLESADLRGRGLRLGVHRLPRLDRLRPGVHRFDQPRLGRQAARRPAAGPQNSPRRTMRGSTAHACARSARRTAVT